MNRAFKIILIILGVSLVSAFILSYITSRNAQAAQVETVQQTVAETAAAPKVSYVSTGNAAKETFSYQTEYFDIVFNTEGASVESLKLKSYTDGNGETVDGVFRGEGDNKAFLMYWGDDFTNPVLDAFSYNVSGQKVIFSNTYKAADGKTFTVVKTYEFRNSDYLFKVSVEINGEGVNNGDYAYTLAFEPQVGPSFASMNNNNYEYRREYLGLYNNKGKVKRSMIKLSDNEFHTTRDSKWISLTGKYFMVIAVPEDEAPVYKYSAVRSAGDVAQTDSLYISVPEADASTEKGFYFYIGPQLKSFLGSYYSGTDNEWGLRNLNLDDAMESGSILGWLESILKWCLKMIYKIVPNYGIAIIILTILIKIATWPIQTKSMASSQKISALTPMMNEIKEKYPNNQQKQNAEIQKLYQEYGISPMSGCTPILLQFLQFPILIAFYGLLNRHFELRGAMFIPGWINDLSIPETVATLPFNLPLLGNQIHVLPFLYVATTVLTMLYTQKSNSVDGVKQPNMWFLTWGMPIMFLFILYAAPSGLFVYWVTQGLLGALQQFIMNMKKKNTPPLKLEKVVTSKKGRR